MPTKHCVYDAKKISRLTLRCDCFVNAYRIRAGHARQAARSARCAAATSYTLAPPLARGGSLLDTCRMRA